MSSPAETRDVDLTNCDKEPIHIPGRIQPHGLLVALSEPDLRIVQISANCSEHVGQPPDALLGRELDDLLESEHVTYLRNALRAEEVEQNPLYIWTVRLHGASAPYDGLVHRHQGVLILELEPGRPAESPPRDFYRMVRSTVSKLQQAGSFADFCQRAAAEVRALTGFDRVMVYKFDDDGHGAVIGEARRADVASFMGLHYPASDIPRQARALYLLNWLRLIADARYQPADIVPTLNPATGAPLDLSYSVLRSVSPVHLEYLRNMGVGASMSISLVKDGVLWGLIACHHDTPKYIPYEVRAACEFLAQAVSLQLAAKESSDDFAYRMQLKGVNSQLVERLATSTSWSEALVAETGSLLSLVSAQGVAVSVDGAVHLLGTTPGEADVRRLIEWLVASPVPEVYATNRLPAEYPDLAGVKDVASGIMALAISRELRDYVIWFRPEEVQTVNWGGEPTKPVEVSDDGLRLSPRKSFALWQQTVHERSRPWQEFERAAVVELRNAILGVVLRKAEELARLNADLERSNSELDAFAYIASHDLKEPLRGLHNYAVFLMEDYHETIDADGQHKLQTLVRLTQRMETLIDSLLMYSRVGRVEMAIQDTDLNLVLREVLEILGPSLSQNKVAVTVGPLPTVRCDRVRIGEVFSNLIGNALKYNDKPEKRIEIGALSTEPDSRTVTLFVRDNGIGIPEKHFETIFRIFKRLHGRDQYGGGTGAGLTIAKKIVERHGGSITVESTPGVGSTFYLTLER